MSVDCKAEIQSIALKLLSNDALWRSANVHVLAAFDRPNSRIGRIDIVNGDRKTRGYIKCAKQPRTLDSNAPSLGNRVYREYCVLRDLEHFFGEDTKLGVARPIAFDADSAVLVTEEVPGRVLLDELKIQVGRLIPGLNLHEGERFCDLCGKWLKKFQSATRSKGSFSLSKMRSYVDRRLENLVNRRVLGFDEQARDSVLTFFDGQAASVPADDLFVCGVHGDFTLGNVIASPNGVSVLDFQMYDNGSPLHDVTHFHHQLLLLGLHPRFRRTVALRLADVFLRAYDSRQIDTRPLFKIFQLQHICCQLSRLSRPSNEWWGGRLYNQYIARYQMQRLRREFST